MIRGVIVYLVAIVPSFVSACAPRPMPCAVEIREAVTREQQRCQAVWAEQARVFEQHCRTALARCPELRHRRLQRLGLEVGEDE